jgi:hypothetical protein
MGKAFILAVGLSGILPVPSLDFVEVGAPEAEIEITPAMIDARVDIFYDLPELLGPSEEGLRATLRRAFSMMVQVHRAQRRAD